MRLPGQGEDSRTQTQDSFLPTHYPALLPACSNCVSTERRAEFMALLKAPGGPFSSSHQLLSVHSAHFLKAYSPGLGKWGFCCSSRLGGGKPAQGGWQGAPEQRQSHQLLPIARPAKLEGRTEKEAPGWLQDPSLGSLLPGDMLVVQTQREDSISF